MYGDWCLCVDYDYLCMRLLHLLKCYFACFNNFALFDIIPQFGHYYFSSPSFVSSFQSFFNLNFFFKKKKRGHLVGFEFFFFFLPNLIFFWSFFKKMGLPNTISLLKINK